MNVLCLEGDFLARALRALGHRVVTAGIGPGVDIAGAFVRPGRLSRALAEAGFAPDLALWCDAGRLPTILSFEDLPCPTAGYFIDTYCNPWHVPLSEAFDVALVAQKDHLPLFLDPPVPRPALWLPLYAKAERDTDPGRVRDVPVSFVGTLRPRNIPGRLPFLEAFKKRHPLLFRQGDYLDIFQRSRVALNQSAVGELNFRTFEAMACGAALLTDSHGHGLTDLFTIGQDILPPYPPGDAAVAAATARAALAHPEALAEVAKSGRDKVRAGHTDLVRARRIVELAGELAQDGAPARRLARLPRLRVSVATALGFIGAELDAAEFPEQKRLTLGLAGSYAS